MSRAATAPVRGQGLGSTMWYACAWWAIVRRFLVGRGQVVGQKHRPGSRPRQILELSEEEEPRK